MPGRLASPDRTPDGRYLALLEGQQGKFHFPTSNRHLNADHGFRSPA
jgi:hypothetical protein